MISLITISEFGLLAIGIVLAVLALTLGVLIYLALQDTRRDLRKIMEALNIEDYVEESSEEAAYRPRA